MTKAKTPEQKKVEAKKPLNQLTETAAATHPQADGKVLTHDGKPPVTHAQQAEDFKVLKDKVQQRQDERNAEAADSLKGGTGKIANNRTGVYENRLGGLANEDLRQKESSKRTGTAGQDFYNKAADTTMDPATGAQVDKPQSKKSTAGIQTTQSVINQNENKKEGDNKETEIQNKKPGIVNKVPEIQNKSKISGSKKKAGAR